MDVAEILAIIVFITCHRHLCGRFAPSRQLAVGFASPYCQTGTLLQLCTHYPCLELGLALQYAIW